ncbi:tigger transposable element-derived protein 1-like [Macrobrachium rosenbergii]|uniref:tigger transposable element-derived protein 1-like n=1 Tax=Macrobrachium rosenbergii TaxID=79674 RepID=UPI0034D4422C
MTLEEKVKLLICLKEGKSHAAVARHFGVNESTAWYIKKREMEIRKAVSASFFSSAKIVSTLHDQTILKMESALAYWIKDCCKKNIPLDTDIIRKSKTALPAVFDCYEGDDAWEADFLGFDEPAEEEEEEEPQAGPSSAPQGFFRPARGGSTTFRGSSNSGVSLHGEAAAKYPKTFKKIIRDNAYHPEQVFNMDETGLFWKKMPSQTYFMKDKAEASGFKAQKYRVTLIMPSRIRTSTCCLCFGCTTQKPGSPESLHLTGSFRASSLKLGSTSTTCAWS